MAMQGMDKHISIQNAVIDNCYMFQLISTCIGGLNFVWAKKQVERSIGLYIVIDNFLCCYTKTDQNQAHDQFGQHVMFQIDKQNQIPKQDPSEDLNTSVFQRDLTVRFLILGIQFKIDLHRETERFKALLSIFDVTNLLINIINQNSLLNQTSMIKKTIVIYFPGSGMPTQAFKNALHIFNIKRVHVNKVNAYVEFQKTKDYEAFRFTNFHGKIPSLHGATYNLVHPDFKWKFPSFNTYTLETLPKEEREETQPGSQDEQQRQDNVSQINGQKPQNIQNLLDEKNSKPIERIQDLEKALKIQRMRQQEQRKSVRMQTTGVDTDRNLISNKASNLKMGEKNYRTLQSIIKTFIVENGKYWSNRMNIWVPLKEQLKEQGEVNEVMKEYGLTILLAIVALIIFLI